MKCLLLVVTAAMLLSMSPHVLAATLSAPEQALYAGNFKKAYALIDAELKKQTDPNARFALQLQRIRTQQLARLSGLPDASELAALKQVKADAAGVRGNLQAEARHVGLVSTYFRRLTKAEEGDFLSLQPEFLAVAQLLADPCHKADALFFASLMVQMSDQPAQSAAGLEQARSTAAAAGCELQLSYDLRHLAVVAEEAGDLDKAAELAAESLAIRRRLKFDVYVPYSLLHSATLAQKRGDAKAAKAFRAEALQLAERLKLPGQTGAARAAIAAAK